MMNRTAPEGVCAARKRSRRRGLAARWNAMSKIVALFFPGFEPGRDTGT